MFNELESMNFKNMTLSTMSTKLLDWALTSGVKLIIGTIIIIIGFKIINRLCKRFLDFAEKRNMDMTLVKFLKSLINYSLKGTVVLVVATAYWEMKLTGLAAIMTTAGVAVGLALQGSLSNFAGGFIILLLRPFKVGDYIQAAGFEGAVEQIGVFYTTLLTIDNKAVLIPNGTLSNGSLINYSAKDTRRVDLIFSAGYESDILKVRSVLREVVSKNDKILHHPEPFVGLFEQAMNSLNFAVRVWVKTEDYWDVYFDLLEQVKIRFDEEGIKIPYQQMDLHLRQIK